MDSSIKREVLFLWSPLKSALEKYYVGSWDQCIASSLLSCCWWKKLFAPNQPPSSLPAHFTWLFPDNVRSTSLRFDYSTFLQTTMLDLHSTSCKPLDREQKRSFFWDPSKGSLHCIVGWGAQTLLKLKCVSWQKSTIDITFKVMVMMMVVVIMMVLIMLIMLRVIMIMLKCMRTEEAPRLRKVSLQRHMESKWGVAKKQKL